MEKQLSTAFLALILETFLILVLLVALIRTLKKLWHENTRVYLKLDEIKNIGLKVLKTDHSKGKKPILFIHRQKTRGMQGLERIQIEDPKSGKAIFISTGCYDSPEETDEIVEHISNARFVEKKDTQTQSS